MATALSPEATGAKPVERNGILWLQPVSRWLIIVGGVLILSGGPAIGGALSPDNLGLTSGWIIAMALGCAIASAAAPAVILAICATLSWRPAWQRLLLFAPALALQGAAYFIFWCENTPFDRGLVVFWLSPLIIIASALPAFLLRLWRQWMIAPLGYAAERRPASIASP